MILYFEFFDSSRAVVRPATPALRDREIHYKGNLRSCGWNVEVDVPYDYDCFLCHRVLACQITFAYDDLYIEHSSTGDALIKGETESLLAEAEKPSIKVPEAGCIVHSISLLGLQDYCPSRRILCGNAKLGIRWVGRKERGYRICPGSHSQRNSPARLGITRFVTVGGLGSWGACLMSCLACGRR